jgi:hypothetical protein
VKRGARAGALPRRNHEHDAERRLAQEALEAGLVGVLEPDVRERALGDGQHVRRPLEEAADFAG